MAVFKSAVLVALACVSSAQVHPLYNGTSPTKPPHSDPTAPAHSWCTGRPLTLGTGPVPRPDTAEAFLAYRDFSEAAKCAETPKSYVQKFQGLKAANSAYGYLGYDLLKSYDTKACAKACSNLKDCWSFNLYFERAPSIDPNPKCKNPHSTTLIRCVFWSNAVSEQKAVNTGQYRYDFRVVIAGSNGYVRKSHRGRPPAIPGYKAEYYGNASIIAPRARIGSSSYLGYKLFDDKDYDPARCATACKQFNDYHIAHDTKPRLCHFFNSYVELTNGVEHGQYCAMYTRSWSAKYAVNDGQYRGDDHITISKSIGFSNVTAAA